MYKLQFDGASKSNPGEAAGGAVLFCPEGSILVKRAVYLGIATNNVAEYNGLKVGLEEAVARGIMQLAVEGDSMLVIQQMSGMWKIKEQTLKKLHKECKELSDKIPEITFAHIYRQFNKDADAIANSAIEQKENI